MKANFRRAMDHVFRWEGGEVDDPHDPGGHTKYGISKRAYPDVDIASLTKAQAEAIYRRDYWNPVQGDHLPSGLDLVTFDAAVNSGVSRGAKWVQQAVGAQADGRIGPATLAAVRRVETAEAIDRAVTAREAFLRQLNTFPRFGRGWLNRTAATRALAHEMAQSPEQTESPSSGFLRRLWARFVAWLRRISRVRL